MRRVPPPPPPGHYGAYTNPHWRPSPAPLPVQEEKRPAYDSKLFYHDEDDDPDTWDPVPECYSPTNHELTDDPGFTVSKTDLSGLDALLADVDS